MKNAMTVVATAILLFFANRTKFGVAVPPEINDPMTIPTAMNTVIVPVDLLKIATRPPPSMVARIME